LPAPASPVPFQRPRSCVSPSQGEPPRANTAPDELKVDVGPMVHGGAPKEEVVLRDATVEDIERIESLTLEDFATDFSKVQIPDREGPVSEHEMKAAVETFLNSLERA